MEIQELIGYYTYRSFLNEPSPVEDFNKIKFQESRTFFNRPINGTINGTFRFLLNQEH